jgi:methylphosphotriester-DNA--protein-cysteine methyltransferase
VREQPTPTMKAETAAKEPAGEKYWASRSGKTFHRPDCAWAQKIAEKEKVIYKTKKEAIADGKKPCRVCKP